jgi:hypothetical protein
MAGSEITGLEGIHVTHRVLRNLGPKCKAYDWEDPSEHLTTIDSQVGSAHGPIHND